MPGIRDDPITILNFATIVSLTATSETDSHPSCYCYLLYKKVLNYYSEKSVIKHIIFADMMFEHMCTIIFIPRINNMV